MSNAIYAALSRQVGLSAELQALANNVANLSTTGFRKEGVVFAEHIAALEGPAGSLSQGHAEVRVTIESTGTFRQTGGTFDLAIEGDGFFQVETPGGPRLTRAGAFTPDAQGTLVTLDGMPVLDSGGTPIFVPLDLGPVSIGSDGTISAGGEPVGQIGLFLPADPNLMVREDGVRFNVPAGSLPYPEGRVLQGFVEGSNVDPVAEIARLIEVQRSYELGQSFLEQEDKRISSVISTIGGS